MSYFGKSISTMLLNANENSREGNWQKQQRHPNAKLTFCHEWLFQGRCSRPDRECDFAHGVNDLNMSRLPISTNKPTKTIPCKYFGTNAGCPFGNKCKYAHGEADLRQQQQPAISTEFLNALMPGSSQNVAPQPRQNEASGNENVTKMLAEICQGIRALRTQNWTNSENESGENGQKKEGEGKEQPPAKNNENEDNDEW